MSVNASPNPAVDPLSIWYARARTAERALLEIAAITDEDTATFRKRGGTYRGLIAKIAKAALEESCPRTSAEDDMEYMLRCRDSLTYSQTVKE